MKRLYTEEDGRKGIAYFVENQIEWCYEVYEKVEEIINNMSDEEYQKTINTITDELLDNPTFFADFDEQITKIINDKLNWEF